MKLAFDTGGTFTDFALLDDGCRIHVHKVLSTPADPARAVLRGIDELVARLGIGAERERVQVFGATTVVTNALLERKGARAAFVTTEGFRDLLRIRSEARYDLYDLKLRYPEPLVPRELCYGVAERLAVDGTVVVPLDEAQVRAVIAELKAAGVESVAICLLHSPSFPAHERRIAELFAELAPEIHASVSSTVAPEVREYLRASTTVVNAYTQPVMRRHMDLLGEELQARGLSGQLFLMTSAGGLVPGEAAADLPVRLIESGPAAGALAAAEYGRMAGVADVLAFDMGGTTAKLTLVPGGRPMVGSQLEVAHLERFKRGSGFPLRIQSIQTFEIGAGGGSIAAVDQLGLLKVGPRSAGADPGPACYGCGGTAPTVTDADLLLGYLDAGSFLNGDFPLDRAAAEMAVAGLALQLGVSLARCAWGIHDLVNESMAKAAVAHAWECGADLRNFTLVAFGGAGLVHAHGVARKLGIGSVICPLGAGVMSAVGVLLAPVAVDLALSLPMQFSSWDHGAVRAALAGLAAQGSAAVRSAGVASGAITCRYTVDMRHVGQGHEIAVPVPDPALPPEQFRAGLLAAFSATYRALYGRGHVSGADVEVITWRLRASGPPADFTPRMAGVSAAGAAGGSAAAARKGHRHVYFDELGGYADTPVYDHYVLAPGAEIAGPAIVEQREATAVVGPRTTAAVDAHRNLVLRLA